MKRARAVSDPAGRQAILRARSLSEVEEAYAPHKQGAKGTLAHRAREQGLGRVVDRIRSRQPIRPLASYVNPATGLASKDDVFTGIVHILAEVIATDEIAWTLAKTTFNGQARLSTALK